MLLFTLPLIMLQVIVKVEVCDREVVGLFLLVLDLLLGGLGWRRYLDSILINITAHILVLNIKGVVWDGVGVGH